MNDNIFCGLAHLGIFTNNLDETMNFYTRQLPFSVVYETIIKKPEDKSGAFPMRFAMVRLNEFYIEIMQCANKWGAQNGVTEL